MHAYWYAARNGFRQATAYRWDFLQSGFCALLFFAVQARLWSVAFRSSGSDTVAGLAEADLQAYLLVAAFLWPILGRGRVDSTVARAVLEGEIALYVARRAPQRWQASWRP